MSFNYTTGVPNPPNSPSVDVVNMQTNTNSINNWVNVDHVGFNSIISGTHNQSTYNTLTSANPTTSGTQGATYTNTVGSNVELMYVRQNSNPTPDIVQLTGPNSLSGFTGYQFLPGGLMIQWGFKNGSHGPKHTFNPGDTGTVTFPLMFPSRVFTVTTNMNYNTDPGEPGPPATGSSFIIALDYAATGTTQSGFNWQAAGSGGSYTVFYWTALGR